MRKPTLPPLRALVRVACLSLCIIHYALSISFAQRPPKPYHQTPENPWQVYNDRYRQYVDVGSTYELEQAHHLVLVRPPAGQPYEQGLIYFPAPACLYVNGRFTGFLNRSTIDINKYPGPKASNIGVYLPQSQLERLGEAVQTKAKPTRYTPAPDRRWRDSLLTGGFVLLLGMLLGTRDRDFFKILSTARVLRAADEDANPPTLLEFFGLQTILHILIATLAGSLFLYIYLHGQNQLTLRAGDELGAYNLSLIGQLLGNGLAILLLLAAYIFVLGISLFNIKIEGIHVRGNLETFTVSSLLLATIALVWNFTEMLSWENFIWLVRIIIFIVFAVKAFILYKILVSDRGLRKFYSLSYICLTEFLPSIFLIRLLTDR